MADNYDPRLRNYLRQELKRPVGFQELADAVGVSVATSKRRTLADDVIAATRHYDLPAIPALVQLGFIEPPAVSILAFTDEELATEILRRMARHAADSAD